MYILLWLAYANTPYSIIHLFTQNATGRNKKSRSPFGSRDKFFAISVLVKKLLGVVSLVCVLIFYNVLSLGPLSDESVKILGLHLVKE